MHLSAQQFAILFVAFALAAVRLLTASQPFWNATPFAKWSTILGPAALAGFAAVPAALSGAHTWVDVGVALLTVAGVAMAAAHGNKAPPAVLMLLVVGLCLPLQACAGVNWPKALQCAEPLAQAELAAVQRILAGNGDAPAELEALAESYVPSTIECAVQSVITDLSARKGAARDDHSLQRGRAFLAKVMR